MAVSIAFLVLLVPVLTAEDASFRIVGRTEYKISRASYQVALLNSKLKLHCGGVIIRPNIILTAAHCFFYNSTYNFTKLFGRAGSEYPETGGQLFSTTKFALHPKWKSDFFYYDLAVAQINTTLVYSKTVKAARLPPFGSHVKKGWVGVATGYGKENETSRVPSKTLKKVDLRVLSAKECDQFLEEDQKANFSSTIGKGCFCAAPKAKRRMMSTCSGDSGGPFVVGNVLRGITSFGNCGINQSPSYFIEVAAFIDFIDASIKSFQ